MQAARAEPKEDMLAVGDRRMRGEAVVAVSAFMRHFFADRPLPERLAVLAIDGEQNKLVDFRRLFAAAESSAATATGTS